MRIFCQLNKFLRNALRQDLIDFDVIERDEVLSDSELFALGLNNLFGITATKANDGTLHLRSIFLYPFVQQKRFLQEALSGNNEEPKFEISELPLEYARLDFDIIRIDAGEVSFYKNDKEISKILDCDIDSPPLNSETIDMEIYFDDGMKEAILNDFPELAEQSEDLTLLLNKSLLNNVSIGFVQEDENNPNEFKLKYVGLLKSNMGRRNFLYALKERDEKGSSFIKLSDNAMALLKEKLSQHNVELSDIKIEILPEQNFLVAEVTREKQSDFVEMFKIIPQYTQ